MTGEDRHIVAMGGGGFSMEPRNNVMDDFILSLARKRRPRVCFLPTASGDAVLYIKKFYRHMPASRCRASHLCLFWHNTKDPRKHILAQDVIYVGGGNTANMLAVWRLQGIDMALKEAWRQGIVLAGISAGANCWFEACSTDSFGKLAPLRDGLGFLPGSVCPHYDGEEQRRPTFHQMIASGQLPSGHALDDYAALHFVGRRVASVVSSRPNAKAYRVELHRGRVIEQPIDPRHSGARASPCSRRSLAGLA
jgi:peptidase E